MFAMLVVGTLLVVTTSLNGQDSPSQCTENGEVVCQQSGICEEHVAPDGTRLEICRCQRHFSGARCEFPNTDCTTFSCKHGSLCQVEGCVCRNSSLYSGQDCSEVHCIVDGKITSNYCKNGGLCHKGQCVCPNNTRGDHCELIACGAFTCSAGYCALDRCACDIPCTIGCDQTKGMCKTEPDDLQDTKGLKASSKVVIGVVCGIVGLVILPAFYAMYNMSIEHRERNQRLQSFLQLEKMTHATYLEKEQEKRARAEAKMKQKEERKLRKSAKKRNSRGSAEENSIDQSVQSNNISLDISQRTKRSLHPPPSRKRSVTEESNHEHEKAPTQAMTAVPEESHSPVTSHHQALNTEKQSLQEQTLAVKTHPPERRKSKKSKKTKK